jgi:ectoine hydroxylase-related dioxygenase (phytanoyl-CoA dioxygenase family)
MGEARRGLVTLPAAATAGEVKEATDRDGGVIVADVLSADQLASINADLDPHLAGIDPRAFSDDPHILDLHGRNTRRLTGLHLISDGIVAAILDQRLLDWADSCLTWCGDILLNTAECIQLGPAETAQVLHRDGAVFDEVATSGQEMMVSCMLALTDFTPENGATRVVPGTHALPRRPAEEYAPGDSVPAVMTAGSALFFTGSVVHGGGANVASLPRRGVTITFGLGWLRTEEAFTLTTPVERARQFPPRLRELLGFCSYRGDGLAYHTINNQDPYQVLFGEERPTSITRIKDFTS